MRHVCRYLVQVMHLIIFFLASFVPVTLQGSHEERLIHDILDRINDYQKLSRPVAEESDILNVGFNVALNQIVKVDEKNEFLSTKLWLTYIWKDYKLAWNESEYGNIETIRLAADKIWTPDILLYNSADEAIDSKFKTDIIVSSNGKCRWGPLGIFISSCAIDIRWFPFDEQRCHMKFGSWTFDGTKLNLTAHTEVAYKEVYQPNGEWDLIAMPFDLKTYKYECCDEPYIDITYTIHVRRRALFYIFNLIIPCSLISILLLLNFLLPPESGQKIALSITILLSMSVFEMIVADMVPATSLAVPFIGIYFACVMIICSLSVVMAVLVLNVHNRSPDAHTMPTFVRTLICDWLAKVLRMSRPGKAESVPATVGSILGKESRSLMANVLNESDLHLRYLSPHNSPSMNANRAPGTSATVAAGESRQVPGTEASAVVPELKSLLDELCYVTRRMQGDEQMEDETNDWKWAAMVIDRLCFWVFSAYYVLLTFVFFGIAIWRQI